MQNQEVWVTSEVIFLKNLESDVDRRLYVGWQWDISHHPSRSTACSQIASAHVCNYNLHFAVGPCNWLDEIPLSVNLNFSRLVIQIQMLICICDSEVSNWQLYYRGKRWSLNVETGRWGLKNMHQSLFKYWESKTFEILPFSLFPLHCSC